MRTVKTRCVVLLSLSLACSGLSVAWAQSSEDDLFATNTPVLSATPTPLYTGTPEISTVWIGVDQSKSSKNNRSSKATPVPTATTTPVLVEITPGKAAGYTRSGNDGSQSETSSSSATNNSTTSMDLDTSMAGASTSNQNTSSNNGNGSGNGKAVGTGNGNGTGGNSDNGGGSGVSNGTGSGYGSGNGSGNGGGVGNGSNADRGTSVGENGSGTGSGNGGGSGMAQGMGKGKGNGEGDEDWNLPDGSSVKPGMGMVDLYETGISYYKKKDYKKALDYLKSASLKKEKGVPYFYYAEANAMMAVIYKFDVPNASLAHHYCDIALKIDPDTATAKKLVHEIDVDETQTEQHYLNGVKAGENGNYEKAIHELKDVVDAKDPTTPSFYYAEANVTLGIIYLEHEADEETARHYFKAALKIDPKNVTALKRMAELKVQDQ